MLEALSTPRNRKTTFILLAACGALAVAAAVVGISDNPPGIALALCAAIAFVLAFVHPWRTSKQYRYFFYAAGLGFFVSGALHGLLEVLGHRLGGGLVAGALGGAGALFFLVAVLLCPAALVVGGVGAIVMAIRHRKGARDAPSANP